MNPRYYENGLHVSRIETSQDGSPYVYVTYSNRNDFKPGTDRTPSFNPFGANMINWYNEKIDKKTHVCPLVKEVKAS